MSTHSANNFNSAQGSEAFKGIFKNIKMPKVDFEAAIKSHKRNLETLSKAQNCWVNCAKTLNEKNMNFMKENFDEARSHMQNMMSSKTFEEKVQAHTERVKNFFDKSMNHGRSLTEHILKSHHEVSTSMQDHFSEKATQATDMVKKAVNIRS